MIKLNFLKKAVSSILYFVTGVSACLLALLIVLNFINPAVSQNLQSDQKKPGFKEVITDIFKNLKAVLKDSQQKNTESTQQEEAKDPASNQPAPSPAPVESFPSSQPVPSESFPSDQPVPPPASESFPSDQPVSPSASESFSSGQESLSEESLSTEEGSSGFVEDLSGVPSDWILDIQSSIAPFIYEYGTQKDPFDDPTLQKSEGEGVIVIPKTPPEEYDLKEINLKGITWHTETPKALFELPNNAGYYTLIKGDKIGKNGVIFEIREDEVVVVETTIIGKGPDTKEEIKVKIKKLDRLNLSGKS